MAKGEVPISYIIALILGIAVVAIIGYWFFVVQSQGGGEMTVSQCRDKAYVYCNIWRDSGYEVDESTIAPYLGILSGGTKWFSVADSAAGVAAYAPACATHNILTTHTIGSQASGTGLIGECESILGA